LLPHDNAAEALRKQPHRAGGIKKGGEVRPLLCLYFFASTNNGVGYPMVQSETKSVDDGMSVQAAIGDAAGAARGGTTGRKRRRSVRHARADLHKGGWTLSTRCSEKYRQVSHLYEA
jgi:hypothetical protein